MNNGHISHIELEMVTKCLVELKKATHYRDRRREHNRV